MDEKKLGRAYFDALSVIKDQVSSNIITICRDLNLDQESIRKIVSVAESSVDASGGNAFQAITKSVK